MWDGQQQSRFGGTLRYHEEGMNMEYWDTLTYTINEIPITLASGEDDEGYYDEFTEVTITGTSPDFRAIGLG